MIKNQRGFSLTEMMVVVGILGIMGLIAVPTLVTALPGYRLKSSARDLCSNMRKARSLAVKQNRPVSIAFNADDHTYRIDGSQLVKLKPDGISFGYGNATTAGSGASLPSDGISFVDDKVAFTTQGLISGGSGYVYLQNSKGQAYRVGARTSGSIIMQQWVGNAWK
jgi:prepilin-type N-terminal cleavage/methylation domain-containing protein